MELETDATGIVTFLPMMNWGVCVVQGRTVGLAVDYYANAADAAAGKLSRIQLHLDPEPAASAGPRADLARRDGARRRAARPGLGVRPRPGSAWTASGPGAGSGEPFSP